MLIVGCNLCKWTHEFTAIEYAMAGYLYHQVKEHWDSLVIAHEHPEQLEKAYRIITGEGNPK